MSRYAIDKVLRQLVKDEDDRNSYQADPGAMLARFPDLNIEEHAALASADFATLYWLGAHFFLLWGAFARLADDQGAFRERYLAAVSGLGYPDFET